MQIHHDGQILVSFLHGNFVNGNVGNTFQWRFGKISFESAFFNVSHGIPRETEVFGNVLARHRKKQIENISFEESGTSPMFFGEENLDLPKSAAIAAMDSGNVEDNRGVFSAEGQRAKAAFFASFSPNVGRLTMWADEFFRTDGEEKLDTAGNDLLSQEGVTSNPVHVVQ